MSSIEKLARLVVPKSQRRKVRSFYDTRIRYFGFRYKCPYCGSHLRELHPFGLNVPVLAEKKIVGGGYRLNALCPVCESTDRERLLYLFLLKKTSFFSEQARVLHVAPERGLSRIIATCPNIDYLTADFSGINVMEKMDITDIDYPSGTFDVIICNHVLEHVVDDGKAMSELYRVLKPGGWGVLQVPVSLSLEKTYEDFSVLDPAEREALFGQSDHVRIYAMDYLDRLKGSGFEVESFDWRDDRRFGGARNKYGLLPSERIFLVSKR